MTESRITNSTTSAIEVVLFLDEAKCGLAQSEDREQALMQNFSLGDGVETGVVDTTDLSIRYRVAPSRSMIAHQALGKPA